MTPERQRRSFTSGSSRVRIEADIADMRALVLFVVTVPFALLLGCAPRTAWRWHSDQGRDCYFSCRQLGHTCMAGCASYPAGFAQGFCQGSCPNEERACLDSCPDLALVELKEKGEVTASAVTAGNLPAGEAQIEQSAREESRPHEYSLQLHDMQTGEIVEGSFGFVGTTTGRVTIPMNDGETLRGEYSTMPEGAVNWGDIYGAVYKRAGFTAGSSALRGRAVAVGERGTAIECEYVTSSSRESPQGHGACRDNHGTLYRLVFG